MEPRPCLIYLHSFSKGLGPETPKGEFDFQAKLDEFDKSNEDPQQETSNEEDDEAGDEIAGPQHNQSINGSSSHYEKDDFFDSISCDALDKRSGVDNRLRGKEERSLNTETFGATALNSQRRRRGRGGGRGGYSGRGGGRGRGGRGRGRGRYYRNNSNKRHSNTQGVKSNGNNSSEMTSSKQQQ